MSPKHDDSAEEALQRFWVDMTRVVVASGWMVGRVLDGRSDRMFTLSKDGQELRFFVKLSLSKPGFWGLQQERADELKREQVPLVLLKSTSSGYFIGPDVLQPLLRTFSRVSDGSAYRINEPKLNASVQARPRRFVKLERLMELLVP